jgi:hypothetical protein
MTDQPASSQSLGADLIASGALFLYSVAVAAGFARVFSGWDFFDNLVAVALLGHAAGLLLRRLRVPVWAAFPATGAVLVWLVGAMFYRDTYTLLLPTSETLDLFRLDTDVVSESFRTAVAPVPFVGGWDVFASLGLAAAVLLADTFAFRAYARAEALVPGGVLFVFVAALGTDRSRVSSTVVLVATGVLATVVLRQHHAPEHATTVGLTRGRFARAIPLAVGSALSIAVIAGVVGPRLPGAGAEAIYDTTGGGGGSVTEVVSPLVDIRSRLTNRETTELFRVQATAASYWRSSALAEFTGVQWKLPEGSLSRADGQIGQGSKDSVDLLQNITISALAGKLLPAAADPVVFDASGELGDDVRWDSESATLVNTGRDLEEGDFYSVVSAAPRFTDEQLATATSLDPGDSIYFQLPDGFPSSVRDITLDVTEGTTNTFEAALAVQDWMQDEFTYSLEVQPGHGNNAIESFLRNRIGYCEQFAGTYAAMMRSIGIPSRVSVGFTSGEDDGDGNYSVLGRNAHAWPEVWFDDIGWVLFEPTPGRGAPAAEYTGLPPLQEGGPIGDGGEEQAPPATEAPPTTVADPNAGDFSGLPGEIPPGLDQQPQIPIDDLSGTTEEESASSMPWTQIFAVLLVGAAIALPAAIRRIRRSVVSSPTARLAHLWSRSVESLTAVGLDASHGLTPAETAAATAKAFPVVARPMQSLADIVTHVNYSPVGADELEDEGAYGLSLLENCSLWARQVDRAVNDSLGPVDRVRRYFTRLR